MKYEKMIFSEGKNQHYLVYVNFLPFQKKASKSLLYIFSCSRKLLLCSNTLEQKTLYATLTKKLLSVALVD